MVTKVLFFDTSALLKLFIDEDGSDVVKWICASQTKVMNSLHLVINSQVVIEFHGVIDSMVLYEKMSLKKGLLIKEKFCSHYEGKVFRLTGQRIISNSKAEVAMSQVNSELHLTQGKNDWDGLHYQSIVNALAYLGGESSPIMVTADKKFANKVKKAGYRVINPCKETKESIVKLFQAVINP